MVSKVGAVSISLYIYIYYILLLCRYMYYRQMNSKAPQWGYVSAPHHCACKLQPKFVSTISSEDN